MSLTVPSTSNGSVSTEPQVILVTGGTGTVGRAIQDIVAQSKLPNETWHFCGRKDGLLENAQDVEQMFEKYKPTKVVHLGARVRGLFGNMNSRLEMFRVNSAMNDNILASAYKHGVKKVVSSLSTCIFPDQVRYPLDEKMVHDGAPHFSNAGYAYAKRMLEVMTQLYNDADESLTYTTFAPVNVFGPYDNFNLQDGHVVGGMLRKIYLAKKDGGPFTIWGSGKPLRQFVYSLDLARLIVWSVRDYNEKDLVIFCEDEDKELSIKELAEHCISATEFKGKVVYDTSKADGQIKKTASNAKLRKLLPGFKFTPIDTALKETYDWLCKNYDNARL